jgi:hypothetical protein
MEAGLVKAFVDHRAPPFTKLATYMVRRRSGPASGSALKIVPSRLLSGGWPRSAPAVSRERSRPAPR